MDHSMYWDVLLLSSALLFFLFYALSHTTGLIPFGITMYAITLIATFTASALYHFTPWEDQRPLLRRIDHAVIFLKIAGTYTPLMIFVGSNTGYAVLAFVWALAIYGIVKKLFFWNKPGRYDPMLYLFMGWISLPLMWSLMPILPLLSSSLIASGGLLYTAGVIFFSWDKLRFSLAIWHGFVFAASACLFAAIALGTTQFAM